VSSVEQASTRTGVRAGGLDFKTKSSHAGSLEKEVLDCMVA
jgi:hypothetical protein